MSFFVHSGDPSASFLGDTRDCASSGTDFPGALTVAIGGQFLEVAVAISALRSVTPDLTGFNVRASIDVHSNVASYILRGGLCTLNLEARSTDGTLTLDFEVGTREPATWNVWLIAQAEVTPVVSAALPVIDPPVSVELSLPFFPALGTVGLLTTLTTSAQGIICSAFETVDTGPLTVASAPKGHELQALFWQHARRLQDLLK